MSQLPLQDEPQRFIHPAPSVYLDTSGAMGTQSPDPSLQGMTRLLNAATAPFPVNLSLNGVPQVAGSVFSSLTSYAPVFGTHQVAAVTKGDESNALLLSKALHFDEGSRSTLALTDSAAVGVDLLSFPDPVNSPVNSGQGFIRTANVSMEGSSFGVNLSDDTVLHEHIPFGCATSYRPLPPGPYSFYVSEDSGLRWTTGPLAAASLEVSPNTSYTLYILGNTWSPFGFRLVPVQDS